jgi:hypothetical protein
MHPQTSKPIPKRLTPTVANPHFLPFAVLSHRIGPFLHSFFKIIEAGWELTGRKKRNALATPMHGSHAHRHTSMAVAYLMPLFGRKMEAFHSSTPFSETLEGAVPPILEKAAWFCPEKVQPFKQAGMPDDQGAVTWESRRQHLNQSLVTRLQGLK